MYSNFDVLDTTGTFDNTALLYRLLSSVRTLELPAGLIRVQPRFQLPAGCRLVGQPNGQTVLVPDVVPDRQSVGVMLNVGVVLDSVAIQWPSDSTLATRGLHLLLFGEKAHNVRLLDVWVNGPTPAALTQNYNTSGVYLDTCNHLVVERLRSHRNYTYGIELHGGYNQTYRDVACCDNGYDGFKCVSAGPLDFLTIDGGLFTGNGTKRRDMKRGNGNGLDCTAGENLILRSIRCIGNWGTGFQIKTTGTGRPGNVANILVSDCMSLYNQGGANGFAIVHDTEGSGDHVTNPIQRPPIAVVSLSNVMARGNTGTGFHFGGGTPGGCHTVSVDGAFSIGNLGGGVRLLDETSNVAADNVHLCGNGGGRFDNLFACGHGHTFSNLHCDGVDRLRGDDKQARYNIYCRELSDSQFANVTMANAIKDNVRLTDCNNIAGLVA